MLRWAFLFLGVALLAALFGSGGLAGTAAGMAKLLFVIFLIVSFITFVLGLVARGQTHG